MNVAYAIRNLLNELFPSDDTCTAPHSTVIAAVILSATIAECVEYVVNSMKEEFASHNEGPW
jgi:uncharacterized phosphosugar-binding protein